MKVLQSSLHVLCINDPFSLNMETVCFAVALVQNTRCHSPAEHRASLLRHKRLKSEFLYITLLLSNISFNFHLCYISVLFGIRSSHSGSSFRMCYCAVALHIFSFHYSSIIDQQIFLFSAFVAHLLLRNRFSFFKLSLHISY